MLHSAFQMGQANWPERVKRLLNSTHSVLGDQNAQSVDSAPVFGFESVDLGLFLGSNR